ncbi:C4-dicarboxylic acid transporter DauA [Venatoribacter cucullus]|uniref:C4-dicarboxylic acid transporter DauA n=1 Tax=Venatoribacter cucullus TaxID=2661630 RepID=UPI00223EA4E3|nr:C4-dicarboxylic acid transporter DauA [Venatoribacter cucullus]UZK02539.1 C4-dicarboxylic acid transporter DauA [Venatoribacter cucullus]
MQHRAHLFSLRIAHALRESFKEAPYSPQRFSKDLIAGITVGIIAIPLSMALAIASGVAPQYGLYTAMIAGFIIALTGGSRYSISGPTAAFVVILYPIAEKFGLGGLLIATFLSGVVLMLMAFARLGRFIEYIPESVTLGFTSGIAIVIATLQLKDFFGLQMQYPETYVEKIEQLALAMPDLHWPSLLVGGGTFAALLIWKKFSTLPPHIPALLVGVFIAWLLGLDGHTVDTIGSRFSYLLPDGTTGAGIPPILPEFVWPWNQPGADGQPIGLSWTLLQLLLPAAFSIAMLGAIESLLCAVVLDNMTNTRHSANSELMGQGIGNMLVPFFGGITATAAIARSAANLRAGAQTPIAAMIHGLVVMAGLLVLAPLLAHLPMASMAALLLLVAWNIAEADKVVHFFRTAPRGDVLVLSTCLGLTVLFDMVIAIGVGIVLAALLFMRDISELTRVSDISEQRKMVPQELPAGWSVLKINGPLFFAAADRVFAELALLARERSGLVLYMDAVPVLDAGGLSALEKFLGACRKHNTEVIIADLQFQPLKTIARSGLQPLPQQLSFTPTLAAALEQLQPTG